jgi:hypothetical protein
MKKIQNRLAIALLLISSVTLAQQESTFTFYRQHMNLVNPAYAGVDGLTLATTTLRRQWTGIVNAPETQAVSFGTSLGNKLGFGMTVISDKSFIERQTAVSVDFSYQLKVNETADLYFGIKAGGNSYIVNTSGLATYNVQADPALGSISTFSPNLGFGALYKDGPLYVSLSIPRLLNSEKATNDAGYASVATNKPHIYLSGGYEVPLQGQFSNLVLKPSAMLRYVNGAPVSVDLTTMLEIDKTFEVGAMYRTDKAYAAMATVVIKKQLVFGYAYEMSTQPLFAAARNTNEILLQLKF